MRSFFLWAGQHVLYWLWFLMWPVVVWRWTGRVPHIPWKFRRWLRGSCLIGGVFWGGALVMAVIHLDFGWVYEPLVFYIPWGMEALRRAEQLSKRYP